MSTTSAGASLRVEGLTCSRGERRLVRDLNFELRAGELLHLRGANGRGKSTVIKTLCGLRMPEAGRVTWGDENVHDGAHVLGWELLYIAHESAINLDLTPVENLASLNALHGQGGDVEASLAAAGLGRRLHLPCRRLSAGQRRRVALARLVGSQASLWLLDEPAAALDVEGRTWLSELLLAHAAKGRMALFSAHENLFDGSDVPMLKSVSLG